MFVPQAGAIVGGRFELTRVIGRGGMGEVWEARDSQLESSCAVKFILQHLAQESDMRSRFVREAKAVAQLKSPHAVHILGVGNEEQALYLAMELLHGETLEARLLRDGPLSQSATLSVLEQVADALDQAHEVGIVHRDLKPDNIWLWSGKKIFVKVLDFGVAKLKVSTASLQTATGSLVGTPYYMSPEQARGVRTVDARSDLWSLAVIAMECMTGRRPFDSEGLGDLLMQIVVGTLPAVKTLGPELPDSLQGWWERALARDPEQRFQTANELVEALRARLERESAPASPRPDVEPPASSGHSTLQPVQSGTVPPLPAPRLAARKVPRRRLYGAGALVAAVAIVAGARALYEPDEPPPIVTTEAPLEAAPAIVLPPSAPAEPIAPKPRAPELSAPGPIAPGPIAPEPIAPEPSAPEPVTAPSNAPEIVAPAASTAPGGAPLAGVAEAPPLPSALPGPSEPVPAPGAAPTAPEATTPLPASSTEVGAPPAAIKPSAAQRLGLGATATPAAEPAPAPARKSAAERLGL